jgi:hypothetical protein
MSWQGDIVRALLAAPEYVNPTIALAKAAQRAELSGDADFLARAVRSGAVERCISEGQREGEAVQRALGMLGRANPAASKTVPVGF